MITLVHLAPARSLGAAMRFIATFDLSAFVNSAVCLLAAFVLGTLIGAERQYRQRSAGLRTNALVALGAAAGSALLAEAAALTAPVIAGATLLRPLVNAINRIPIDECASEATYEVRLTTTPEAAAEARETLVEALESAHYPVADVETSERGDELVDIVATLVATSVVVEELDAVAVKLERAPGVEHATWESVATG